MESICLVGVDLINIIELKTLIASYPEKNITKVVQSYDTVYINNSCV